MSETNTNLNNGIINIPELEEKIYGVNVSVIRLNIGDGDIGSGFLCKIYINNEPMPVLITCYHIISDEYIKNNSIIYFTDRNNSEKNVDLKIKRIIYQNEDLDVTIIEIKEEDHLDIYSFLEMDNSIVINNPNILHHTVHLFHYPSGKQQVHFSKGTISDIIMYNSYFFLIDYETESGSSGSPIIDYDNDQVIGIHQGKYEMFNSQKSQGILLKFAVEEFIKEKNNEIKSTYKNYYPNSNTMDMIYIIPKNDSIQLFSELFVSRYKSECKFRYNKNDYPLTQYFELENITEKDKKKGEIRITLKNFDSIENMDYMFSECKELKKLIATGTDFSKIESMKSTFEWCPNLEELTNTSKWNVENVKSFKALFYKCENLEKIPGLRKWNPINLENYYEMFLGCQSKIDFSEISAIKNWEKKTKKKKIKGNYMQGFGIKNIYSYLLTDNIKDSVKFLGKKIGRFIGLEI